MNKSSGIKWVTAIVMVTIISCNREKTTVNLNQDAGLPPSLQSVNEDPGLIVLSEKEQSELSIQLFPVKSKFQD